MAINKEKFKKQLDESLNIITGLLFLFSFIYFCIGATTIIEKINFGTFAIVMLICQAQVNLFLLEGRLEQNGK